ncbi:MAG: TonB-dependent receptor plug domain-containing protein, partial [Chitinophagaceae bacterium]|nr:TonB-dependent receptor plug domain-containing protein [Chitinophagaceae bacterium]
MKRIHTSLLLLFILAVQSVFAQNKFTLSGKVTNGTNGAPLVGATVHIHDANRELVTDADGQYKTSALPAGKYLVEVSYVGFESRVELVEVSGNTTYNFSLATAVVEQEGVTVTGVSAATRLRQSPQPVTIIKKADLTRTSSTNIINSLSHIPGVSALSTGPAIAKPFIRGLGYNRVVVVNDGIRQEGQQWGDEHGIEIDDYSAQRIEVLKGPASLMYGS